MYAQIFILMCVSAPVSKSLFLTVEGVLTRRVFGSKIDLGNWIALDYLGHPVMPALQDLRL